MEYSSESVCRCFAEPGQKRCAQVGCFPVLENSQGSFRVHMGLGSKVGSHPQSLVAFL